MSMDWARRVPPGMKYVGRSGNLITWSVEFPVNDEGFLLLQCPQTPEHRFGVKIASNDDGTPGSTLVTCPYCGYQAEIEEFYTPDHRHRVDDVVQNIADQIGADMARQIADVFRGSRNISVSSPLPAPVRPLHSYEPEHTRRVMTCGSCGEIYAVYGIALFCVACGQLSPAESFSEILRIHRKIVEHLDSLPPETRAELEADGVFTKINEETVKDTFSALENFLAQVFTSRVNGAEQILARRGNIFQRLTEVDGLFQEHLGISLASIASNKWPTLLEGAALRHLLTHKNGVVDTRYLRAVPTSRFRIGQRVHVGRSDAAAILDASAVLADALLLALQ